MGGIDKILKMLNSMLSGTVVSVEVFLLTLLFAIPLAVVICAGRMSRLAVLREFVKIILLIVRGTPLMLQLICVYFIPVC